MKNIVFIGSILSIIFIQGCAIQSNQLSNLLSVIGKSDSFVSQNGWIVRYKDYESIVYAVNVKQGILFANAVGDQILFDGWMVSEISGLGQRSLDIKIDEVDGVRTFKQGTRTLGSHACQEWQFETNSDIVRWYQNCEDRRDYHNSILVLEDGNISVIRQIVDERYTALNLTKLK